MKLRLFLICLFLSFLYICSCQTWPKVYHYNYHVYLENVKEDYDKGYLICGNHLLNPSAHHYGLIMKTDLNGNKLWEKRYGDLEDRTYFTHMEKTSDGGAIFSGGTNEIDSWYDSFFLKVDACYQIQWCKIIASPSYNYATYIRVLPDGTSIGMMRYYNYNGEEIRISLIKLDESGEPVWIQGLVQGDTTINNVEGYHLLVTSDSNFLVSGDTGGPTPLFVFADSTGEQEWELKWKKEQYIWGISYSTVEKDSGIFYSAGTKSCGRSSPAPAIFKFNSDGEQLDDFCLLGDTIHYGWALPICTYNDSSFLVGIEWEDLTYEEGFSEVFMIDSLGSIKNRKLLFNEKRTPDDIIKTSDDKILVGGHYVITDNWEIDLFKLNENLEDDTINPIVLNYDTLCTYQIPSDTLGLDCGIFVDIEDIPSRNAWESTIRIFPDPAGDRITLNFPEKIPDIANRVVVYDIFGREILKENPRPENNSLSLDISGLSPGLYFVVYTGSNKKILKGKFVVAR